MDPVVNKYAARYIPIAEPLLGEEEQEALFGCIKRGWISQGPKVAEFEDMVAKSSGKKYGSACNSGTTALHLALHVCDVKEGDEVIIPNLTMIALANAVLLTGATPVFAEADDSVGNVSLKTILKQVTEKTKAIVIVHTYGEPVIDTEQIAEYCTNTGIKLIEDCAEAHFATLNGRPVGSFGDLAVFSFYSNKNITTGEGGMVVTDSLEVKERLDRVRMHAFTPGRHFWHTEKAFGYRMTDMQAAIGIEQMKKAPKFMRIRRYYRKIYEDCMRNVFLSIASRTGNIENSGVWVLPVLANVYRDEVREYLAEHGIETRTYFQPMNEQAFLTKYDDRVTDFSVSKTYSDYGFYLPLYPKLSLEDIVYIICTLNKWRPK